MHAFSCSKMNPRKLNYFFAVRMYRRFPNFDFSEIIHDDDVFYSDERESDEHCCERAVRFLEWLNSRPEKCIAGTLSSRVNPS